MQNNKLTELEKLLYNKHLAVSRQIKNKPFKLKRDFSDIFATEKPKWLKRISTLILKHPEIDLNLFFEAPYKLYPDVEYFGLDYFSSMRAVKSYTIYKKTQLLRTPDLQLEEVKKSMRFIAAFCIKENIYLHQYANHRTSDLYTWMKHYKENKINIYTMFIFPDVLSKITNLAEDLQKFFVSDFVENFQQFYINFNNSIKIKSFLQKAYPLTSNFIQKEVVTQKK